MTRECPDCRATFNRRSARANHMNKMHSKCACTACDKPFYDESRRDQHARMRGPHTTYKGRSAGNAGPNPKVKNHSCAVCERRFSTVNGLRCHEKAKGHCTSAATGICNLQTTTMHSENTSDTLNAAARSFHDSHARATIHREIDPKIEKFEEITSTLCQELQKHDLVTKRVKVGSARERTDIPGISDFDVLFTKVDTDVTASLAGNGEYTIRRSSGDTIPAVTYKQNIKGELQKILNIKKFGKTNVILQEHGPAITLDVRGASFEPFSIDVVPSVELTDGRCFVSKSGAWRLSHSYEAKNKMANLDAGNKCGKEVYRTWKVIIKNAPNLRHVTSYQLKSALFHVTDRSQSSWERSMIGERILEFLRYLREAYTRGRLPDYYDENTNLIGGISVTTRQNAADRFTSLLAHPLKMFEIN